MTTRAAVTFDGSSADEFTLQSDETPYTLHRAKRSYHERSIAHHVCNRTSESHVRLIHHP
jgi:hypothetical protein